MKFGCRTLLSSEYRSALDRVRVSLLFIRTDLMAVLHTASCYCLVSHTIPLIHPYRPTSGLIWWRSYTLLLLPLVTYNSSHSLLYIRTDLMAVLHTAATVSCHIQFLSFTPIHQDWSDGGLTHCCYWLLSHTIPLIHSYTSGLIWWRSYTLLLLSLVTYNSSHSHLYIRTDLMAVLHTAATVSCHIQFLSFTPIGLHQDWSDGGLTHCCYCLLSHTIPLIHSYTSGLIWWRSYTLLLLSLVTYNSSHSLL